MPLVFVHMDLKGFDAELFFAPGCEVSELMRIPAMALGGRVLRGLGSAFRAIRARTMPPAPQIRPAG